MPHPLEELYGLTANELLDALNKRFRAKVALEGAVAEVKLEKHIKELVKAGVLDHYEAHDLDGHPDFSIWLPGRPDRFLIEVKNVRNSNEAYRIKGNIVGYKVEVQKTRAATGDSSSRFYNAAQFQILAVCMGKKTKNWDAFMFVKTDDLARHKDHTHKLAVMHKVPLENDMVQEPWFNRLEDLVKTL